jgi:hypothetical protein
LHGFGGDFMDYKIILFILAVILIKKAKPIYQEIQKFILKREQIKADAMIKSEEIRARNQLELEKLMMQDELMNQQEKGPVRSAPSYDETLLEKRNHEKEKL